MSFEKFVEIIKNLDPNTSIGIHGIRSNNLLQDNIEKQILNDGLKLYGWGGILSSVKMFGRVKDLSINSLKELYNYSYGIGNNGEIINILFGFPEVITNSNDENFYLGYFKNFQYGTAKGEKNAGNNLPLNELFDKTKLIPNDFIIGCLKQNNGTIEYVENSNYFEFKNSITFFDDLFSLLRKNNIINIIDLYDNRSILDKYGIDCNYILEQYDEYLSSQKTKAK